METYFFASSDDYLRMVETEQWRWAKNHWRPVWKGRPISRLTKHTVGAIENLRRVLAFYVEAL